MPGRIVLFVVIALLAGCGGPKSDADAVGQALKDAARAAADRDGDKACSYLTPDAQRQAQLEIGGGILGKVDCPTFVKRATAFMTPLDKKQIEQLEPANVQVNGTSASATMATPADTSVGQPVSIQLNLQKVGEDWKISGFGNAVGLPGS